MTRPDLRLGAELLCDLLLNATMPEKSVAREKEVQLAGIRDDEEQLTTVARNICAVRFSAGIPTRCGSRERPKRLPD